MTSTAKLLAFDDDKDTAIFQLKNGKVFACPSDYIIAAAHHDSLTKQVRQLSLPHNYSQPQIEVQNDS